MDIRALSLLTNEMLALTNREDQGLSKAEQRRLTVLLAGISAIKAGATLDDVEQFDLNERREMVGLGPAQPLRGSKESRTLARWLRTGLVPAASGEEVRTETVGNPEGSVGLTSGLGFFVPIDYYNAIVRSLSQHSPLFDSSAVTFVDKATGAPMTVPSFGDVENVAVPISEGVQDTTDTNISNVTADQLQLVTFRSPRLTYTLETDEDAQDWQAISADVLGDRLARGIGAKLLNGSFSSTPEITGLIPTILTNGSVVTAIGSSETTGGSQTGANSIGLTDLANVMMSCNAPYRASSKFAFLMNSNTYYNYVLRLLDKMGHPVIQVNSQGVPTLWGKPVLFDESMPSVGGGTPSLGNGNICVLAGDFSYWLTVVSTNRMYLQRYLQGPGLIDQFRFAMRAFLRSSGCLMYSDPNPANSPIFGLQSAA